MFTIPSSSLIDSLTIDSVSFENFKASDGAVINHISDSADIFVLGNCTFRINQATNNGGVIYSHRAFVIQLYLNDDFDGGETEFLYQNRRESAKEGEVLIFPAGYTHTHRGNPPIGGTKYIITTWAVFQDDP